MKTLQNSKSTDRTGNDHRKRNSDAVFSNGHTINLSEQTPEAGVTVQGPGVSQTADIIKADDSLHVFRVKERLVQIRLNDFHAAAKVVHQNNQTHCADFWSPDYLGLTSDSEEEEPAAFESSEQNAQSQRDVQAVRGFYVFDGFDRLWFVMRDYELAKTPSTRKGFESRLRERKEELDKLAKLTDRKSVVRALRLLATEAKTACRREWACYEDDPKGSPLEWEDVKHHYGGEDLVDIVARTRLVTGKALLPGYYRVQVLQLTKDGGWAMAKVAMPDGLDVERFRERLDAWFPAKGGQGQIFTEALEKKLERLTRYGTIDKYRADMERVIPQLTMRVSKVGCTLGDKDNWTYTFREDSFQAENGPEPRKPEKWTELMGHDNLQKIHRARDAGKYAVVAREIQARRQWKHIQDLEESLRRGRGEPPDPEFTEEQLAILDELAAKQSNKERELGRRYVEVMKRVPGLFDEDN